MESCATSSEPSLAQKIKAKSLFNKATSLEENGQMDEAIQYYKQAFKLDPKLEKGDVNYEDDEVDENAVAKKISENTPSKTRTFHEIMQDLTTVNRNSTPSGFKTFDALEMFSTSSSSSKQQQQQAKEYLENEGYVVIDNVLSPSEISEAINLFYNFLDQAIGRPPNTNNDVASPSLYAKYVLASRISNPGNGIVAKYGAGQSKFNWFIRSRPFVKDCFRTMLFDDRHEKEDATGNQKMITSFDGLNFIVNEEANSDGGGADASWLHFDASGSLTANYLQGLVNLLDVTDPTEPSFVVVPKSNRKIFPHLLPGLGRDPSEGSGIHYLSKIDMVKMTDPNQLNIAERPFRVPLKPGSIVIWKSSTLHCGIGCSEQGRAPEKQNPQQVFRRIASYVCMAKDPCDEEITNTRRESFFRMGVSSGHQPDYCRAASGPADEKLKRSGAVIVREEDLPEGALELL